MSDDLDLEMEMAKAKSRASASRLPDEYRSLPLAQEKPEPGWFEPRSRSGALLRGAAQGASLGVGDELSGAVNAATTGGASILAKAAKTGIGRYALQKLTGGAGMPDEIYDRASGEAMREAGYEATGSNKVGDGVFDAASDAYAKGRDTARNDDAAAHAESPRLYSGANFIAGLAVPLPGPGKLKPMQTVLSRSGDYARAGLKGGAILGAGNSEADLSKGEFGKLAADTGTSALFGGAIGGAMGGPGEYAAERIIKPYLQRRAATSAVSAIAPNAGLANRLRKKHGIASDEEIQDFGNTVLDMGVLKPFGTAGGALERTENVMGEAGSKIGDTLRYADDLAASGTGLPYRPESGREAVSRSIKEAADVPALQAEAPAVEGKLLDRVGGDQASLANPNDATMWDDAASFAKAWKNKSILQKALKPDEFSKPAEKLYRQGVRGYTGDIYSQVEAQVGPDMADQLREAAKRYGSAAKVEDLLRELNSRNQQRGSIGLMDTQVGGIAGDALKNISPMGGPVVTALSALTRGRMDSTRALGLRGMARGAQGSVSTGIKAGNAAQSTRTNTKTLDQRDEEAVQAWLDGT